MTTEETATAILNGVRILQKYETKTRLLTTGGKFVTCTGPKPSQLTSEDATELLRLDWTWSWGAWYYHTQATVSILGNDLDLTYPI